MTTTTPAKPSPSSFSRRLSHPNPSTSNGDSVPLTPTPSSYLPLPLPLQFPNVSASVSGLRAALLGYLGEVENALREKLGRDLVHLAASADSVTSGSCPSSVDGNDGEHMFAAFASSSALSIPGSELRHRGHVAGRGNGTSAPGVMARSTELDASLLHHLSTLREDILAYAPTGFTMTGLGINREWLRNLPSRLSVVDLGVGVGVAGAAGAGVAGHLSTSRAVQGARKRVIDLVHALLPPDDWAGWETLGWEEQDVGIANGEQIKKGKHVKSNSASSLRMRVDQDDDEDEPEYLFPNRTPASAQALARRRIVRSMSLGAADHPRPRDHVSFFDMLGLAEPNVPDLGDDLDVDLDGDYSVIDDELASPEVYDKIDDEEAAVIVDHPETADTKLTHIIAPSHLGPTVAEALARSEDGTRLVTYMDLPYWWRNNQYIITGYRFIPLHTKTGPIPLIKSAFSMHNETVNIHSHFIPTLVILTAIPLIIWSSPLPDAHWLDTTMLVCYLLAATSCLVSSAGWHVLSGCASRRWFEWGACVDYIGISWLIAMSFNTVVYNAYYCHPKPVVFYTLTNLFCGALGSYLPFQKWFNERKNKNWRIAFFLFLNVCMIAPMVQLVYQEGYERGSTFVSPFGLSVVTYVFGLLFYAFHVPECLWPGKFDNWGASHQIWHFAIVGAIILHYRAIFVAHAARWDYSCAAADAGEPVSEVFTRLLAQIIR